MKKVAIVGKDPEKIDLMKDKLLNRGFEFTVKNPDLVITYGGDGIFLIAERICAIQPSAFIFRFIISSI